MIYLLSHSCGKSALPWQPKGNNPVIVFAPIMTLWSWLHRHSGSVSVNDHWIDACTVCFFCVQGVLALLCSSLLLKTLVRVWDSHWSQKMFLYIYTWFTFLNQFLRLLRLWVRIPPGTWVFVSCECCVLSGRGLCVGLITRLEESYRLCCVVVYDHEAS
jgi:hypothetical protein